MIKVELEALDGQPITERTGKSKVRAFTKELPKEMNYQIFGYDNENCDSPGVCISIQGLESIGNEYKFHDHGKRLFKVTVIDE